jgi:uncharacterized membrane protein YqaE (UPF0057 family)
MEITNRTEALVRYFLCLLPPLAVLSCGKPGQALLNLVLTLLLYFPGVIHAVMVVNGYYADQRTERIVKEMRKQQRD